MYVEPLSIPALAGDSLRLNMGRLIGAIGTSTFEQVLFEISHAATGCSHVTAFSFAPDSRTRAIVAVNEGANNVARRVAERYVGHYWHLDPANRLVISGGLSRTGAALRIKSEDIGSAQYRSECYTNVELGERFSVIQRCGARFFRVNFYASSRRRAFQDDAVANILGSADLLVALLARHDEADVAVVEEPDFMEVLQRLQPDLSRRELQICGGIARGMSSEGISIEYGISLNTVLTYRKRAYTRLGITSQNELLRYVLGAASASRRQ